MKLFNILLIVSLSLFALFHGSQSSPTYPDISRSSERGIGSHKKKFRVVGNEVKPDSRDITPESLDIRLSKRKPRRKILDVGTKKDNISEGLSVRLSKRDARRRIIDINPNPKNTTPSSKTS